MTDVVVFAGGIIPEDDRPALFEEGVRAIFGPGTTTSEILDFLKTLDERAEAGEPIGVGEDPGWHWE
jgi:methylmalonyl-CoA mutase C-terminal domain/subunit